MRRGLDTDIRFQICKPQAERKKQPENPFLYKCAAVLSVQNTKKKRRAAKKNPVIIRRDESFLSRRLRRKKYPGKTEKILNNPEMKADVKLRKLHPAFFGFKKQSNLPGLLFCRLCPESKIGPLGGKHISRNPDADI